MTNYDFNVSHSNPHHQKLISEFGKEVKFNIKQKGQKCNRDKYSRKLVESPATMASGNSTIF